MVVHEGQATIRDMPDPVAAEGEAIIRVHLAGICATDLEILKGYAGFEGIAGHEFVGTVLRGSPKLLNKRVVGEINCVCGRCDLCQSGLSSHCRRRTVVGIQDRPGVFAEKVALPELNCHIVPDAVTDEEAVFAEPLAAAYQVIRQIKIEPRSQVSVLGTGRLGLLVAQVLAQTRCRLIAIGRNPKTLGLLDRKGIRTSTVDDAARKQDQDIVVDCTGSPDGLRLAMDLVRPRGTIVMKTTCTADATLDWTPLVVNEITLLGSRCGPFPEALAALARKQIDVTSMITRQLPLEEGPSALALAGQPNAIKVLLRIGA